MAFSRDPFLDLSNRQCLCGASQSPMGSANVIPFPESGGECVDPAAPPPRRTRTARVKTSRPPASPLTAREEAAVRFAAIVERAIAYRLSHAATAVDSQPPTTSSDNALSLTSVQCAGPVGDGTMRPPEFAPSTSRRNYGSAPANMAALLLQRRQGVRSRTAPCHISHPPNGGLNPGHKCKSSSPLAQSSETKTSSATEI
ncbi:hypothetical protein B0H14DRAFT_2922000 [Mycena olivaceomarginata]|nr:hypothetical protein B0H14DRAFT_2922000 [Mycena olivaceomarginata]